MAKKSHNRDASKATAAQVLPPGSIIRFETPSSDRKAKPNQAVIIAHELQEINPVTGFTSFLKDYAVVGLAIGFIVGLQAQTLVKSLVDSFIDPAFQLLFGEALDKRTFVLSLHGREKAFPWGSFVHSLLYFLFVLAAIFIIVKIFNLDKYNKVTTKLELDKIKEKD